MGSAYASKGRWKIKPFIARPALFGFLFAPLFVVAAESVSPASQPKVSPYQMQVKGDDVYRLSPSYRAPVTAMTEVPALARLPYSNEIAAAAKSSNLDPALVHAVVSVESGHRQSAVSPKGAAGLMQLMPGTALRYGVTVPGKSHEDNLRAGTRYLRDLLNMFENRLDLALAAYNAGEGAVQKYGNRIPPFRETQNYVPSVLEKYNAWRSPEPIMPQQFVYLPGTRLDRRMIQDSVMAREE